MILLLLLLLGAFPARAFDGLVEKQSFTLPSYVTTGGRTVKSVKFGYETYGSLNAAKDNVVLVEHFFSGTSHAAGKYREEETSPGYWDALIGPKKAIDTDRFFVISVDCLANINVKIPTVVTTGPASIDPDTGKPYGMRFPIVTIRDFVNVQKALLVSLGVRRLRAVIGPGMGAMEAFEWAAAYPEMVERIIPVTPAAETAPMTIAAMSLWGAPIRLDPLWNNGDYFGKAEPVEGLTLALAMVTLQVQAPEAIERKFGRRFAEAGKDPALDWASDFAVDADLRKAAAQRARTVDADSFLYLVRANQLYRVAGAPSLEEGLSRVQAPVLMLVARNDLVLPTAFAGRAATLLKGEGKAVSVAELAGDGGQIDFAGEAIVKLEPVISDFLAKPVPAPPRAQSN